MKFNLHEENVWNTKMKKNIYMLLSLLFLFTLITYAQEKSNSEESSPAKEQINNDTPSQFKLSFSERFRIETWDNAVTLSKAANGGTTYDRNRTSLMGQWLPNENLEAALMLTNEYRYYFSPTNKTFTLNEIFFDQLYIKYKDFFGSVTLGRQNIALGEGFIVMDGGPLDGSRSGYFNAARIDLAIDKSKLITGFVSYVPQTDNILPLINSQDQQLIEQPEAGIGIYFAGQFDKLNLQPYYIYKQIYTTDLVPIKSDIHTIGTRASLPIADQFTFTVEGAYQFGSYGEFNRSAFGGYSYLDYATKLNKPFLPDVITIGGIYLSGDDHATSKMEGWDPVFSRWPKWSESYIYTLIKEYNGKVAYWSNFASLYGKVKFTLMKDLNFNVDYHHMFAPEKALAGSFPGGTGNTRGDLIIAKLLFDINSNISGHLLWEKFIPGNYYFEGANGYSWTRIEFLFKI
jgi:hypothetical protein